MLGRSVVDTVAVESAAAEESESAKEVRTETSQSFIASGIERGSRTSRKPARCASDAWLAFDKPRAGACTGRPMISRREMLKLTAVTGAAATLPLKVFGQGAATRTI